MSTQLHIPPLLKEGDRIVVISPSRKIFREQLQQAWKTFKTWGLKAEEGSQLWQTDGYFAGSDEQRKDEWNQAIGDPTIKAIFCARGGYGLTRNVDTINFAHLKDSPKWIIGFSDITAAHLRLDHLDVASIHGLMPAQFGNNQVESSLESLHALLFNGQLNYTLPGHKFNQAGKVTAPVIGGNLSLLAESLGTPTEIHTDKKILFIEEIDEYLYKVDRMMNQLKRANKFDELAGVILGDFSLMKDTEIPFGKDIDSLLKSYFNNFDIPVAFGVPMGHEDYNLALPLNIPLTLQVSDKEVNLTLPQNHNLRHPVS